MENPIFKAYEKLDDSIMYIANKGVKAWNWTTGQTKADLANQMLTVAPILEITGGLIMHPILGIYCTPFLLVPHMNQLINKKVEGLEIAAAKKGLKPAPEIYKPYELAGPLYFGFAGYDYSCFNEVIGTGFSIRAASKYVMRADYLPPGKSVFERAKDKLVEKLKASTPVPVAQPSLVPVPIKYSPNFDDFIKQ